ncbi:hypothetical protein QFC21_000534 [Naganishia friedmannii]|uniref:Uncharacterized protein n=1 Tax=Naganishia friedmannii TaxID=89922 RepID=A0ACC2WCY6_9TREE|nr:hypothetical protein QFC21_000534 [Naganishia friedmannii]
MSPPIAWVMTPTEEEFYNALAPDLKKKVDAVRAQRLNSEAMQAKLEASAAADKVVWADSTSAGAKRF